MKWSKTMQNPLGLQTSTGFPTTRKPQKEALTVKVPRFFFSNLWSSWSQGKNVCPFWWLDFCCALCEWQISNLQSQTSNLHLSRLAREMIQFLMSSNRRFSLMRFNCEDRSFSSSSGQQPQFRMLSKSTPKKIVLNPYYQTVKISKPNGDDVTVYIFLRNWGWKCWSPTQHPAPKHMSYGEI